MVECLKDRESSVLLSTSLASAQAFSEGLFAPESALLVVIDIQERLLPIMSSAKEVVAKSNMLLRGASALQIPILVTEQYPKGLGRTDKSVLFEPVDTLLESIQENTPDLTPRARLLEKVSFSIFGDEKIVHEIATLGVDTLLVCGIESHVCVLQSTLHALKLGLNVWVANDALSSRDEKNHHNALALMAKSGANVANTESLLFGAMRDSKHPSFKTISALVK